MAILRDTTIAIVEDELPAAMAYCERHGWMVSWQQDQLLLQADGKHPHDRSHIRLQATLDNYRFLPPAWVCFQAQENGEFKRRFPKGGTLPGNIGSIFHGHSVICAPFNRLAYGEHSGPHSDWGGPAKWLDIRGHVSATVLAEMLAQIVIHLRYSPGWNS